MIADKSIRSPKMRFGQRWQLYFFAFSFLPYSIIVWLSFDSTAGTTESFALLTVALILVFFRNQFLAEQTVMSLALDVTFVSLYVAPAFSQYAVQDGSPLLILFIFLVVSDLLRITTVDSVAMYSSSGPSDAIQLNNARTTRRVFGVVVCCLTASVACVAPIAPYVKDLSFTALFAVAILSLELIIISGGRYFGLILATVSIFASIVVYLLFAWSGFGRLMVVIYVLAPILLLHDYHVIRLSTFKVMVLSMPALLVLQMSRYGGGVSIAEVGGGSAGHHMEISSELLRARELFGFEFQRLYDQVLLFFFNFIPRAVWTDKPVGIGLSLVDDWYGREGVSEGFSVSVGFIGELIYLIGNFFSIGLILSFLLIRFSALTLQKMFDLRCFYVMFCCVLITYFWGGFASFGARFWIFAFPLIAIYTVRRVRYGRPQGRRRTPK